MVTVSNRNSFPVFPKKKICLVVSAVITVNTFLREPIRKLAEAYEVHLVVNISPEESLPGLEASVKVFPVRIERKIAPVWDFLAVGKLYRFFRREGFSLVHSVTPKAGLLAMTAAFLAGVGIRIHTFTGQVWATRRGLSRWLLKNVDRLIGRLSTHNLVDAVSQRQFLLDEGVLTAAKAGVLAQGSIAGVDVSRFKPDAGARTKIRRELGIPDEEVIFLFLGRLNHDKGLLDLAAAFAGIDDDRAHLLVVGPDEEQIAPQMLKLAGDNKARLHFVGFTAQPEAYLAAADVLCLPSYREGFGNVVIEAAAVGIPAIGSRIYGVVDAVLENETGLLFEPRQVPELQICMQTLLRDRELRSRLGRQARKRVWAEFTAERLAAAWLDYYRARL